MVVARTDPGLHLQINPLIYDSVIRVCWRIEPHLGSAWHNEGEFSAIASQRAGFECHLLVSSGVAGWRFMAIMHGV